MPGGWWTRCEASVPHRPEAPVRLGVSTELLPELDLIAGCLFYGVVGRAGTRGFRTLALIASLAVSSWTLAPLQPAAAQPAADSPVGTESRSGAPGAPVVNVLDQLLGTPGPAANPATSLRANDLGTALAYADARGLVGLAVLDRETGTYVDNGVGAQTPMGSASIVKVLMAEELLHRAALGEISLGPSEYARIEAMLIYSDDPAASSLYSQFGAVSLIEAALARHGLTQSASPADPQYWGNAKISAHDVVRFYDSVLDGSLPTSSRDYLFGLLRQIAPLASDGFGQLFGVADVPVASGAAVKQGWMCCLDGVRNIHSSAVVGDDDRYVVVILTQFSPLLPWSYGLTTTTALAGMVLGELSL